MDSGATLPTAIFAHNDVTAIGIMEARTSRGVSVPGDMAIVGCGNIELGASPLIGLMSIDQHARERGRVGAQATLDRIAGPAVTRSWSRP